MPRPSASQSMVRPRTKGTLPNSTAVNARIERFGVDDNVAVRVAHGDGHGLRAAHHHAFDDGLSTIIDLCIERLLAVGGNLVIRHKADCTERLYERQARLI